MELGLQFLLDGFGQGFAGGDEEATAGGVLGLGEEFGGDLAGVGGVVGEDDDFGGAGEGVDVDDAVEFFFGELDVGVAGADDFVDGADGGGAEGHGGDGLGAADGVDFGDANAGGGGEDGGGEATVPPRMGEQRQMSFTPAIWAGMAVWRTLVG